MTYRTLDLFSGAGGLSLGFDGRYRCPTTGEQNKPTPFRTVQAIEHDEDAANTFDANFDNATVLQKDIRAATFDVDVDVVIGGPPCQGFSSMKRSGGGTSDEKNDLWQEFYRAVNQTAPSAFVIENVPPMRNTDQFQTLKRDFEELGYTLNVAIIDATDYGVPQKRKRLFVIGTEIQAPVDDLLDEHTEEPCSVEQAIGDLSDEPDGDNWHVKRNFTDRVRKRMSFVPQGGDRIDVPDEHALDVWKRTDDDSWRGVYGRLEPDKPSTTLQTDFTCPSKGRFIHPTEDRTLTPREGARLQTLPDAFTFPTNAKTSVVRQIGNAVPPKLAYKLSQTVASVLE